jgi:CheY-like chemotaxis protein
VQRALESAGHEVITSEDGGEALAAFESGPGFDLVVTDVEMPNVSGLELAERLLAKNAGQRILIMSGLANELARAQALVSANVRLINKPVSLENIRSEAAALLG